MLQRLDQIGLLDMLRIAIKNSHTEEIPIAFHSVLIWIVLSMIPMLAGLLAFGIDVGSLSEMVIVSYIALGAVGVAVAIPSAPGFFGTYQLAFKTVLEQFGVDSATALALGLVVVAGALRRRGRAR